MIIDAHVHPVLFGPICKDPERVQFRKQQFGLYKSSPIPMEQVMAVMDHAGVDLAILFAEDYSAVMGQSIVSNEEIRLLMDAHPGRFAGFASVDPRNEDAPEELARAFTELKLDGLKLNLSHLQMYYMQQAARVSDNTAFFLLGDLVEFGRTETLFSTPTDKRTEDYITGRFG